MEDVALSDQILQKFKRAVEEDLPIDIYQDQDTGGSLGLGREIKQLKVPILLCPSDENAQDKFRADFRAISYAGVAGSAFSRRDADHVIGNPGGTCGQINVDGILFPASDIRPRHITDGLSKTALIGERWYQLRLWPAGAYHNQGGPWGLTEAPSKPVPTTCASSCKNFDARLMINPDLNVVGYYVNHDQRDRPIMPPGAQRTITF